MISRFLSIIRQLLLPPGATAKSLGDFGEDRACAYLSSSKTFKILLRNWKHGKDEIDIIALDEEDVLVFVEVRLRKANSKVPGFYSVNRHKKQKLLRGCRAYLKQLPVKPKYFRFDIVEVRLLKKGEPEVNHYQNVGLFPKDFLP